MVICCREEVDTKDQRDGISYIDWLMTSHLGVLYLEIKSMYLHFNHVQRND